MVPKQYFILHRENYLNHCPGSLNPRWLQITSLSHFKSKEYIWGITKIQNIPQIHPLGSSGLGSTIINNLGFLHLRNLQWYWLSFISQIPKKTWETSINKSKALYGVSPTNWQSVECFQQGCWEIHNEFAKENWEYWEMQLPKHKFSLPFLLNCPHSGKTMDKTNIQESNLQQAVNLYSLQFVQESIKYQSNRVVNEQLD